jgi:redox-sensitive bicupin YhaK (pirin superfamily)
MITQSKGKMFLADERGLFENDKFRSLTIFNFGSFRHIHKEPFGTLYGFSENTLAAGTNIKWTVPNHTSVTLIPVVGTISVNDNISNEDQLQAGMAKMFNLPAGASYEITNPCKEELIKYLQLWINTPDDWLHKSQTAWFDLDNYKLTEVFFQEGFDGVEYACSLVKLNGRQEGLYNKKSVANGLFVYAIQGALEVQYRLLHEGDGLALWDLDEIEFEALSNDAILLIVEVPMSKVK